MGNTLRVDGSSTRLLDQYVQDLFKNGTITIRDHYDYIATHRWLFHRFMKRLELEHPNMMKHIKTDKNLTVKFEIK